jgi:hypothetical protein
LVDTLPECIYSPIMAMGFLAILNFQLEVKIAVMGIVDTFRHSFLLVFIISKKSKGL